MADIGADVATRIRQAQVDGIRFVQLQFTDIIGHVKAVTIPIYRPRTPELPYQPQPNRRRCS